MATKEPDKKSEKKEEKTAPPAELFVRDLDLNIHQRVNLIMAETYTLIKEKTVEVGGGYNVITSDQVMAQVQPLLVKYGVNLIPTVIDWGVVEPDPQISKDGKRYPYRTEATVRVAWINIDTPADQIEGDWFGFGIDSQDKGPGKAMTYAIRYATIKTLQIPSGDKDVEDGDQDTPPGSRRSGGKKYPDNRAKSGGARKVDPKKLISEKQAGMINAVANEYDCPAEMVGERMAKHGKAKLSEINNEEMDDLLFFISAGKRGKELKK